MCYELHLEIQAFFLPRRRRATNGSQRWTRRRRRRNHPPPTIQNVTNYLTLNYNYNVTNHLSYSPPPSPHTYYASYATYASSPWLGRASRRRRWFSIRWVRFCHRRPIYTWRIPSWSDGYSWLSSRSVLGWLRRRRPKLGRCYHNTSLICILCGSR